MKILLLVLAGAALFMAGSIVTAIGYADFDYLKAFATPILTLVSTYIGAHLAFQFNRRKDADAERAANLAAGNRAVFTLGRQLNRIVLIKKQLLDPDRHHPLRHLAMQASVQQRPLPEIDFDSIAFLLATSKPNLIGELAVAQEAAHATIDALNDRSRLHITEVQPLAERAGIRPGGHYTHADFERALGSRLVAFMQNATDQLYEAADSALEKLAKATTDLHELLKSEFRGGERITRITIPDLGKGKI